ncbi:hypothetical protein WA158_007504 [Blastocystis sp. Blastoise]
MNNLLRSSRNLIKLSKPCLSLFTSTINTRSFVVNPSYLVIPILFVSSYHSTSTPLAKDYYSILGVSRDATKAQIKKKYFELAKKYHPDTNKDPDAKQKFVDVSEAYEILGNEEKRKKYDTFGTTEENPNFTASNVDMDELLRHFSSMFNGEFSHRGSRYGSNRGMNTVYESQEGEDIQLNIRIPFLESVHGCQKDIQYSKLVACPHCNSTGHEPGSKQSQCPQCRGTGYTTINNPFMGMMQTTCPQCGGKGSIFKDICKICQGTGQSTKNTTLSVSIPSGVENGERIRLIGQGNIGILGGPKGHLYLHIQTIPDPFFSREGNNIICSVPLSLSEAVLGTHIQVPTIKGQVEVKVPQGTQCNTKLRLRGQGIYNSKTKQQGDQILQFDVKIPKSLTTRQQELMTEFAKEEGKTIFIRPKNHFEDTLRRIKDHLNKKINKL